jgi:hypothetical protein
MQFLMANMMIAWLVLQLWVLEQWVLEMWVLELWLVWSLRGGVTVCVGRLRVGVVQVRGYLIWAADEDVGEAEHDWH